MPNWKKVITSGSNAALNTVTASVFLSTTGSGNIGFIGTASWAQNVVNGGGTPGGLDTQIQFNSASIFSGSANLTFKYTTSTLRLNSNHISGANETNNFIHGSANTYTSVGGHAEGAGNYLLAQAAHVEGNNNYAGAHGFGTTFSNGTGSIAGINVTGSFGGGGEIYLYNGDSATYSIISYNSSSWDGSNTYVYVDDGSLTVVSESPIINTANLNDPLATEGQFGAISHVEGEANVTIGVGSHAEGNNTRALGNYSHAEGGDTRAIGNSSHAEGRGSKAIGIWSHAEGVATQALGDYSHAGGNNTIASASYGTVVGQFNLHNNTTDLFTIGDGTGDGNQRHDLINAGIGYFNITGSVGVLGGITGSLFGTASFALTASLLLGSVASANKVDTQRIVSLVSPTSYYVTFVDSSNLSATAENVYTSTSTKLKRFSAIVQTDDSVHVESTIISASISSGVGLYGTASWAVSSSYALSAASAVTSSYVTLIKSGVVTTFAGNPKTGSVTFVTAYPTGTNYAVTVTGGTGIARSWTVESKTTTGFIINSNSNTAISGDVNWIAVPYNS